MNKAKNIIWGVILVVIGLIAGCNVLGIADNMVYSGENNNILPDFKVIRTFMKNEWEVLHT